MSERQIKKNFKKGDMVELTKWVNDEPVTKQGVLKEFLSGQFFVSYPNAGPGEADGDFFFYTEKTNMKKIDSLTD